MTQMNAATFDAWIDQTVTLDGDDGSRVDLTVEKVERLPHLKAVGGVTLDDGTYLEHQEPFSVVLKGPKEPAIPAMTYSLTLPDNTVHHLMIGPFRQDGSGTWYEISFS